MGRSAETADGRSPARVTLGGLTPLLLAVIVAGAISALCWIA